MWLYMRNFPDTLGQPGAKTQRAAPDLVRALVPCGCSYQDRGEGDAGRGQASSPAKKVWRDWARRLLHLAAHLACAGAAKAHPRAMMPPRSWEREMQMGELLAAAVRVTPSPKLSRLSCNKIFLDVTRDELKDVGFRRPWSHFAQKMENRKLSIWCAVRAGGSCGPCPGLVAQGGAQRFPLPCFSHLFASRARSPASARSLPRAPSRERLR